MLSKYQKLVVKAKAKTRPIWILLKTDILLHLKKQIKKT